MKSYISTLAVLAFLGFSAAHSEEQSLKAEVKKAWTIDGLRTEAFKNVPSLTPEDTEPLYDPNRKQNLLAIAAKARNIGNRSITVFEDGSYAIAVKCALVSRYYTRNGTLDKVSKDSEPSFSDDSCPKKNEVSKSYRFDAFTEDLENVGVFVSGDEGYIYSPDGTFQAHWIGSKCYNLDGSSCGTRTSYRE